MPISLASLANLYVSFTNSWVGLKIITGILVLDFGVSAAIEIRIINIFMVIIVIKEKLILGKKRVGIRKNQ